MSLRLALKRSLLEKESSSSQSQHSSSSSSAVVATPTTNNNTAHNSNNNKKKKKKQSSLSCQENKSTKNYHKKQKITKNNNDTTNSSTIVATTLLPNSMSTCIANTTTMPSTMPSALISSSCQETSYNNNNYYNNNHHNNHINIPQPPKQKYSIGTSIEKDFIDPLTNKSRTYHATIERYEYVLQKRKWMYYVFYEDGEGEHLVESAIKKHLVKKKQLENDPKKLFIQYFGGLLFVNSNPNNERRRVPTSSSSSSRGQQMMKKMKKKKKDINWNMFLEDLERVPDLASINDYQSMGQQQQRHTTTTTNDTTNTISCSGAYPLQYALLYGDDVPMVVIEKLIELNWEAVGFIDDHYGYDTLSWMMMFHRRRRNNDDNGCCCFRFLEPNNINPNILELVLKESYENVEEFHSNRLLTQTFITTTNNNNDDDDDNEEMNECTTTIDYMIDQVGHINPSIIEVIFKYSPPSVAWVLIRHFKSEKIVSSHILTLALKAACDFERYNNNNDNDDDVVVENKHATTTTTTFFDENWFDVDSDYTSVWNDIVLGLDGTDNDNVELFHSYVKAMATVILQKRRDDRYNNNNHNHDDDDDNDGLSRRRDRETTVSVDDFSICLPSCVLYCLSEWETNLDHLWNTFAEKCPTELLRCVGDNGHHGGPAAGSGSMMTKQGRMNNPLHVAIRLGFQYEPVIKSLVEANNNDNDDECLLDSLDSIEHLPPVLLAAATTPVAAANQQSSFPRESKNLMGTSYLSENEYLHLNHINNTYNLLLANPSILKTTTAITMDDEQQDPQAATSTIGVGTNQGWDDNFDYF